MFLREINWNVEKNLNYLASKSAFIRLPAHKGQFLSGVKLLLI